MYRTAAAIILELLTIALLVIGITTGVRKGFFKSLMDLLILVVAVFVASQVCNWINGPIVDHFYPKAEEKAIKAIDSVEIDLKNVDLSALELNDAHPDSLSDEEYAALQANSGIAKLVSAMQAAGLKENRIRTILAKTLKTLGKGGRDLNAALTESAKTTTKAAIRVIVQIVLFLIIVLLVSVLLQILVNGTRGLIWKVDVLKSLDKFLGFLLGAILMLAVILIVFYICGRLHWSTFETAVDQTLFSAFLQENNPLRLFLE